MWQVKLVLGAETNIYKLVFRANRRDLLFYSSYDRQKPNDRMEIDFLFVSEFENAGLKLRVSPVEVKSSNRYSTLSLDKFKRKYSKFIGAQYVLHPKALKVEGERVYLPLYMAFCL